MFTPLSLILIALTGCSQGGNPAIAGCNFTDTALAADDEVFGRTVTEHVLSLTATTEHAATWSADGTQTVAWLDLAPTVDGAQLRESDGCGNFLTLPAIAALETEDGGITELVVELDLEVWDGGAVRSWVQFQPEDLVGSWEPAELESGVTRRGLTLELGQLDEASALTATLLDETEGADQDTSWAASEEILALDEGTILDDPATGSP